MTMPGLPKLPAAQKIDIADDGQYRGYFKHLFKIKDLFSLTERIRIDAMK